MGPSSVSADGAQHRRDAVARRVRRPDTTTPPGEAFTPTDGLLRSATSAGRPTLLLYSWRRRSTSLSLGADALAQNHASRPGHLSTSACSRSDFARGSPPSSHPTSAPPSQSLAPALAPTSTTARYLLPSASPFFARGVTPLRAPPVPPRCSALSCGRLRRKNRATLPQTSRASSPPAVCRAACSILLARNRGP